MQYFQLEHPLDRTILCDYSGCENVADHLDVNEEGHEYFLCSGHTGSAEHASRLPKRAPGAGYPYRSKPAA
jgi:hypothetical protein